MVMAAWIVWLKKYLMQICQGGSLLDGSLLLRVALKETWGYGLTES